MNRRDFSKIVAGAASILLRPPLILSQQQPAKTAAETSIGLYERGLVLDCNSGPALGDTFPLPQSDLDMTRSSGVSVVKLSLGGINMDFAATVDDVAWAQK